VATKGNSGSLLSKMAKFVRHPTTDWNELDKLESEPAPPEPDNGYSKQALKEMIERKRQNDFVRRLEFDHLRKLRRNVPTINPDVAGRPSFFQSSMASNLDERATTLKKIDEIEAQMSKQWWKGKQDEAMVPGDGPPESGRPPLAGDEQAPMNVASRAGQDEFKPTQPPGALSAGEPGHDADDVPTQMGMIAADDHESAAVSQHLMLPSGFGSLNFEGGSSGFSTSKLFSLDLGDSLADPDLEEAAIRFANGDDAGAEAGLLAALGADKVAPESAVAWATALFDLYRATGQKTSFDSFAIDYAVRFGRSAPGWFSIPELLGQDTLAPSSESVGLAVQLSQTEWECPSELDLPAVHALTASLAFATVPWHLNWSGLTSITPDAAKALARLFADWCSQPVSLQFDSADVLEKTLRSYTPSGDRQVDYCWWALRLDALRILRLQDEFELAALDFCVTYEVSPPPWEDALCECLNDLWDFSTSGLGALGSRFGAPSGHQADSHHDAGAHHGADASPVAVVALSGEVQGDAAEALNKFQDGLKGADRLVISCANLIRVDFSAAGSILNWVALREAEGCQVQFHNVPHLVAAFFSVIGINEHAKVILRTT
jgi:ABC-type transporter Mla MlaB component